jgi:hypothetical protein
MGDAVIASLETAVVLVDGLELLDFGCPRGCEIAFDLGVEGRLVAHSDNNRRKQLIKIDQTKITHSTAR